MVGRQGFEPWKPMATDLQSAPFVHLGTCPKLSMVIIATDRAQNKPSRSQSPPQENQRGILFRDRKGIESGSVSLYWLKKPMSRGEFFTGSGSRGMDHTTVSVQSSVFGSVRKDLQAILHSFGLYYGLGAMVQGGLPDREGRFCSMTFADRRASSRGYSSTCSRSRATSCGDIRCDGAR
jgi:hypothetical protein